MSTTRRLPAIDVLRGMVMVLMAIDHASGELNGGRLVTDSVFFWTPGTPLPLGQFLTRWMTHLCAPTFVFLSGVSLAMSVGSRIARGARPGEIDRHILIRGLLLLAFEIFWMSWAMLTLGRVLFQVLFAIGASLLFMIPLRRLGDRALVVLAFALLLGVEPVLGALGAPPARHGGLAAALLVSGGTYLGRHLIIAYPVLPWLAIMSLGWVLGRRILVWRADGRDEQRTASKVLLCAALGCAVTFAVARGLNGYGNTFLLRESGDLVQWLHVSKYPPSVTFTALELGIAMLVLGILLRSGEKTPRWLEPLRRVGQVALFFYLLHIHLLMIFAKVFHLEEKLGLASAYVGGIAVFVLLYPACLAYHRYKVAHPATLARFV